MIKTVRKIMIIVILLASAIVIFAAVLVKQINTQTVQAEEVFSDTPIKNGLCKNEDGNWYFYNNGARSSYTGFVSNENGEWYCEDGQVSFDKQGIIKDDSGALSKENNWYYVIDSKVQTDYTGISDFSNENGWWYIKDGKVDLSYNGIDRNSYGWWCVKNGKVDFSENSIVRNVSDWWVVRNGMVDLNYTGFVTNTNGTWYCKNGRVQFNIYSSETIDGITYDVLGGRTTISSADLVTGGSDDERNAANEYVCKVPASVVYKFVNGGGTITFVDQFSWGGHEDSMSSGMAAGYKIELRNGAFGTDISVPHEIGHFLDYYDAGRKASMKYSNCDEFNNIMNNEIDAYREMFQYKNMDTYLINECSTTEYFADAFSMYCRFPSELKNSCPDTYNFIEKAIELV